MFEMLTNIGKNISPVFYKLVYMSIIGTIMAIAICFLIKILDNKLSAKNKFIILLIPLIFLIIPINKIQINTNKNLGIIETMDKVEITLENMYDTNHNIDLTDKNEINLLEKKTSVLYIIPILWGVIWVLQLSAVIIGSISIKIKIVKSEKCRDTRIKNILNICTKKLNIKKRIEIKFQDFNASPCIYGIINPKILLPKELKEKDNIALESIFMHELAHYKRKDMITNYILLIIASIHWFNPFIHYIFKKIRQVMELATDEIALNKMDKEQKRNYGLTLLSLLQIYENTRTSTRMLCITDDSKNMEKRIRKIKLSNKYKLSTIIIASSIIICLIIPFTIKPTNAVNISQRENENNQKEQSNNINEEKVEETKKLQEERYIEKTSNQSTGLNVQEYFNGKIIGNWKPYKAERDSEEIGLREIYGTSIKYGGSLNIKEDGTYTELIGAYSEEDNANLVGTYQEQEDIIELIPKSGIHKKILFIEKDNILIEQLEDGTLIYFKK